MKMGFSDNSYTSLMVVMMIMVVCSEGVAGLKEVSVGGHSGWHVPDSNQTDFYNHWAQPRRFHIGDSLRFQYQNDSVLLVDKFGYYHCDPSKATSTFNDGNTVIKLENSGLIYFISGSPDHCRAGQRMVVDVMSPHPALAPDQSKGGQAESPSASAHKSGSYMVQVSELLGLLVATSSAVFLF